MKLTVQIVMILLLPLTVICQKREFIAKLHQDLAIATDETSRIDAQIGLCSGFRLGNTDSSLYYGQLALSSSEKINYHPGQILALSFMGITTEQTGNLPQALAMLFKALELAKANQLEDLTSPALNGIGEIYILLKNYPKALHYFQLQKSVYDRIPPNEGLGYAYYDIGIVYEEMNQLDSALSYELKALEFFRTINRQEPLVYKNLGNISLKSGNKTVALRYYKESIQIALQNEERRASATAYNKIASWYTTENQPDSGIFYAKKGLEDAKLIAHKKAILDASVLLSELYESKDPIESLRYLKIADAYKDSVFGAGNLQAIQSLVALDEEHQQEITDARVKYQNQLKQYSLIAGVAILLIVAIILQRNNRQKQKANKVLAATLSDLKATQSQLIQSEKMASLGEMTAGIAHEIQNPLNFVNNFSDVNKDLLTEMKIEIEKRNFDEVKLIADDVIANEEKINHHGKRADSIVKGMLLHSRSDTGEKELTDINTLTDEYLRLAYHGIRAKDKTFNANLIARFDSNLPKIKLIPQDIGRVLLNLFNNSFYAVAEGKKLNPQLIPEIVVTTSFRNNHVEITVKDNGNGIPPQVANKIFQPFFTTKPTGQGTGLGLSISYDIIKAHGGELSVEIPKREGAEFVIHLPLTV